MANFQTSPIVEDTWRKRKLWKLSKRSLYQVLMNIVLACMIYADLSFGTFGIYDYFKYDFLWYLEVGLCLIFTANALVNIYNYLRPILFSQLVEISNVQRKLLAVHEKERGFRTSPLKHMRPDRDSSLIFNTSSSSPHRSFAHSTPSVTSPGYLTPSTIGHHSFNYSTSPTHFPHSASPSFALDRSGSASMNMSYGNKPYSPTQPVEIYSLDNSSLRSRFVNSYRSSPSISEERITDISSLSMYLKEQEEKEYKSVLSSPESMFSNNPSFWSFGRTALDYSPTLRKGAYQLASKSPQLYSNKDSDADHSVNYSGDEVWSRLRITEDTLFIWIERLRKWLSLTVVSKLAQEITEINSCLRRIGCEESEIGEASISTLKQIALTKSQFVPSLNSIIPYLDKTSNQEYLVKRIKDLGRDGCMSEFFWNAGGHYGKKWEEHLPTDASIIMHLLCSYFDSRLPAQPNFPDGKTFTSQYFKITPDKPDLTKKDNLLIYQSSINPPHYQVIIGDDVWNLPKGRNNMFSAVLLFLYHVKVKEHGMLGRVNLGMSGINLLWILNNTAGSLM